jgi:Sulfotransferase family
MDIVLSEVSAAMKQESPVFIVGAPRSGTSILYRTLQNHSSFKPQNCKNSLGVELTESNIFKAPYSIYAGEGSDAFAYLLSDPYQYQQFVDLIQPILTYQQLLLGKELLQKAIPSLAFLTPSLRALLWKTTKNDILVRAFLYYAKQSRGVKRILEKTPQHISRLPEIKETFPDAKLLFMPRHPIDVFSSYRRRLQDSIQSGMDKRSLKWLEISPQQFCRKYASSTQLALNEWRIHPESFMLVCYEDFTRNTQAVTQQILTFLDEVYEEGCIAETKPKATDWGADPNLFGAIKSSTKKWQDFIDESEAQFIETRLSAIMQQLNYERYTSSP